MAAIAEPILKKKPKKSKNKDKSTKRKREEVDEPEAVVPAVTAAGAQASTPKKKKTSKRRNGDASENVGQVLPANDEALAQDPEGGTAEKKKKRKSKKRVEAPEGEEGKHQVEAEAVVQPAEQEEDAPAKKKRKKKAKATEGEQQNVAAGLQSPVAVQSGRPVLVEAPKSAPARLTNGEAVEKVITKEKKQKKRKEKGKSKDANGEVAAAEDTAAADDAAVNEQPAEEAVNGSAGDEGEEEEEEDGRQRKTGNSFRRVKSEEWLGKKGAMDNTYEGTFGKAGWGYKAQQVLGQVRGKDFRHEKTKKKRGSYMGGKIDAGARTSFKYDSD